ncbi:hypothetical protein [Aquiflexum lacus]|uniref:hypothetical protein n=1 Tax=Aquiflexum lacus TaxID=2483805 RepID=UPI001892E4C5|nr:hypothetical protein [Aquiflexum lacus]
MKRKTIKTVIMLSAILLTGNFILKEFQGRKNLSNFKKIEIGTSKDEVIGFLKICKK